jgi:ABC-type sulfate/molybdate transport systems ATPase subunit
VETLELDIAVALRSYELDVRLSVGAETVALVGPSGAGKSTVLRAIAGLRAPDRGRIALGHDVWFDRSARVDRPPDARSVGLVFQEYALFPHMTVRRNVAFGAGAGGRAGAAAARVDELLERLGIAHLAAERPGHISGGERQRVALARALARDPGVLLLDEPLSALDAHTRASVRAHLQDLLGQLRLPTIVVTHDFRDATALADRIGVIVDGRLRQIATADELVRHPRDAFVASFTGGNVLAGQARPLPAGGAEVRLDSGTTVRSADAGEGRVGVAVYPWELAVAVQPPAANGLNAIGGPIAGLHPEGDRVRLRVGELVAECAATEVDRLGLERGQQVYLLFEAASARIVEPGRRPTSPPGAEPPVESG